MSDAERYGVQADDELEEEHRRALRAEGSRRKPPKPTGNVCKVCVPFWTPAVGSQRSPGLFHSLTCPDKPGEPISAREYAIGRGHPSIWERR